MKRSWSLWILLCIGAIILSSCAGLTSKPEEALWGGWDFVLSENGDTAYAYNLVFGEDSTLSISDEKSTQVQYTVIAPGRMKFTQNGVSLILQYELSDERLSFIFDTGSTTYQRSPSLSEVSVTFTQESLSTSDLESATPTSDDLSQKTPAQTISFQSQPSDYFLSLPEPVKVRNTERETIEIFSNPRGSHMFEKNGVLWIGGWGGVIAWDMASGAYKHYSVLDGLITNTITSIALTPSNEILVGCYDGGLSKFTGNRWETFGSHRLDTILAITDDGIIWVTNASRRSLGRYEDGQWEFYESWGDLVEGAVGVGTVIPTTEGGMIIRTRNINNDTIIIQYQDQQWRVYSNGLTNNMVLVANHFENIAWLFDRESHELGLYDGYNFKGLLDLSKHFEGDRFFINSAHYDPNSDSLYFAVVKFDQNHEEIEYPSLAVFRNNEIEIISNGKFLNNRIYSIFIDDLTNLWISTQTTLYQSISNNTYHEFKIDDSDNFAGFGCRAIIIPHESSVWCAGNGLSHYYNNHWRTYTTQDGLANNSVYSATMGKNGTIWLGAWNRSYISKFEGENFTNFGRLDNFISSSVWDIDSDLDGNIWATADGGIVLYDGNQFQLLTIDEPDFGNVRSIFAAPNGDIWVGGYDHENGAKIGKLSNSEWTFFHKNEGLDADTMVSVIDLSPTGIMYAGTRNGLFRFINERWEKIEGPRSINGIAFGNDGSVWVVTEFSGVHHYKGGEWVNTLTIMDGLPGLRLHSIAVSPDGSIWVGGNGGVVKITPNE